MGQSMFVALKSLRIEIKRIHRRRSAEARQKEEHQNILAASGSTSCAVAFEEDDRPLVDPPFL